MKYFKNATGDVFAYEADGSQDAFIPQALIAISEAEANALRTPLITQQDLIAANTREIQAELDRRAQARGYDNIVSACSYAAQSMGAPFQAEGAAFLAWRSAVWLAAYAVLDGVKAGTAAMPSPAQAVAAMPALVLPS